MGQLPYYIEPTLTEEDEHAMNMQGQPVVAGQPACYFDTTLTEEDEHAMNMQGQPVVVGQPTCYFEPTFTEDELAMHMQGQPVAAGQPMCYFEPPYTEEDEREMNMQGRLVAAGQPVGYFKLPCAEGEDAMTAQPPPSAWAYTGDPGWACQGEAQPEGWLPQPTYSTVDPSAGMPPQPPYNAVSRSPGMPPPPPPLPPPPLAAYPWGPAWSKQGSSQPAAGGPPRPGDPAWPKQGSSQPAAGGPARPGDAAPKRRRPQLRQGFPCSGPAPLRRACRNKRNKMDAYVEEVAAQLQANPHADISQVEIPEVILKTPWLQKHAFIGVRELLRGCGRPILDADFLLPAAFTAGRRREKIADRSSASQRPMVPLGPMVML